MSRTSIYENRARQEDRRRQREQEKRKRAFQNAVMATMPAYNTRGNLRLGEDVIIANVNEWQRKATEAAAKAEERAQSALAAESHGDMKVASVFWGDSWSYDQKAKNFSAEALRYEAMLKPPKTAPKETAPDTAPKTKSPVAAAEKKRKETEITPAETTETKDWKEYLGKSVEQVVKGKYADESTLLGTAAEIGLAFTPLDVAQDLRDLSYDLTHLKTTPWHETALDVLALIPVLGAVKPIAKAIKGGTDAAKTANRAVNAADDLTTAAKHGDDLVDAGKAVEPLTEAVIAQRRAEILEAIEAQMRKSGVEPADPAQVLDPKALEEYNRLQEAYAKAAQDAAKAGDGDFVTYYRVQTPGDHGSKELILANEDGTITFDTETFPVKNTSVSAYNTDHATIYAETGKRAGQSYVVAFDVPVWFDEFIRENAILQHRASTSPLNKGGTAPKMTDVAKAGFKFEFPSFWNEWLEKHAVNARKIDIGDLS